MNKNESEVFKTQCRCNVLTGNQVKASYRSSDNLMYRYNPYIEALPSIDTSEKAISLMRRYPGYSEGERLLSARERLEQGQKLSNYVEPLNLFMELEQRLSRVIRNGYFTRNPISTEWKKQLISAFPTLEWNVEEADYIPLIHSSFAGFCMLGTSGIGKSLAVLSVLSLYPQVITHTEYNGHTFLQTQLVWLIIECPHDGSIKGLCLNFLQSIDGILNTRYYERYGRRTVDELIPIIGKLAGILGLGVLVIDEIQRLNEAKSGGSDKMLNFFVQLNNTIGVPVILVGTYDALHLIANKFANARRNAGQGDMILSNMTNNEEWEFFVDGLWKYQWTNPPTPLSPELRDALHAESLGILDIAVKLYQIVQWSIIGSGDERITPKLLGTVARQCLKLIQPALDALRSGDIAKMAKYGDVYLPMDEMDAHLQKARERISSAGTLPTLRNLRKTAQESSPDLSSVLLRVTKWLIDAGIDPEKAYDCSERSLNGPASGKDLQTVFQEAWSFATESQDEPTPVKQSAKKKTKTAKILQLEDMRSIIKSAGKGVTAYDALKAAGIIRPAEEFLRA